MDLKERLNEAKELVKDCTKTLEQMKEAHAVAIQNQKKLIHAANGNVRAYQKLIEKAEALEK
jgi:L-lysine 2,3-aminomutase